MSGSKISRRKFAKMVVASTGALVATAKGKARAESLSNVKVIVVGAGIAGLGAAKSLANQGAQVTVLEGRDKIGGRIATDWSMGAPFEVGAGWIHGPEKDNPIRGLSDAVKAEYYLTDDESLAVYDQVGKELDDGRLQKIERAWEKVHEHIEDEYDWGDKRNLVQAIDSYNSNYLKDPGIVWAFSAFTEFNKGGPIEDLSAHLFDWDKEFDTEDVILTTGYDEIVKPLAEGLEINLGHMVTNIAYRKSSGVAVTTDQGTFDADYCICTVPLGVLKKKQVTFEPPLPKSYQKSIDRLGFGSVTKIALKFAEPFWDTGTQYFGVITEPKGRWNYWLNYRTFSDENILLGLSFGTYALIADRMTKQQMTADAMDALRQVWKGNVSEPTEVLTTHWSEDPFALGAYTYPRPKNDRDDFDDLADGIKDRLFLAGEHTIFNYAGTTHGAYMSGLRAAEHVIDEAT